MLDQLQDLGLLRWQWDYENSSAVYWIARVGQDKRKCGTRQAEDLVVTLCQQEAIIWLPVPAPGGERERAQTERKMAELHGQRSAEGDAATTPTPITASPFDLSRYPSLRQRLHDEPGGDRSLQVYQMARHCIDVGLSDREIKWFLAHYRPCRDKYGERPGFNHLLDRVIARARDNQST